MAKKGDWVQLHIVVLEPDERAQNIPEDTRRVPLEMWAKGTMESESALVGDTVTVTTRTGRHVEGTLCCNEPSFSHSFGTFVPELLTVDDTVRRIVFGGEPNA